MAKSNPRATTSPRQTYHHGNLVEALVAAAVAIVEEHGIDRLSVREVAKRAGVSAGAPFRHFPSKTALLTAVAEQAMEGLVKAVAAAQAKIDPADPIAAFEAIGHGYLNWALAYPTHFQIISSRTLINFTGSAVLMDHNAALRSRMVDLLTRAKALGTCSSDVDVDQLVLSSRAFVYGLARMTVDGHFPEWHPIGTPTAAVHDALSSFMRRMLSP